jgi:uncharacterized protein (DUF4415 family)
MRFEWDEAKNRQNLRKHRVRFETAVLAFDDPVALTLRDNHALRKNAGSLLAPSANERSLQWSIHALKQKGKTLLELSPRAPRSRVKGERMRKLTKEQKREIGAIAAMKDKDIDFSDIPLVLDWSGAEMGKFYRPPKKAVTIRLDADVLEWLKGYGKGYQTRANFLLRHAMASSRDRGRRGLKRAARAGGKSF